MTFQLSLPGSTDFFQHGTILATPLTSSFWLPTVHQSFPTCLHIWSVVALIQDFSYHRSFPDNWIEILYTYVCTFDVNDLENMDSIYRKARLVLQILHVVCTYTNKYAHMHLWRPLFKSAISIPQHSQPFPILFKVVMHEWNMMEGKSKWPKCWWSCTLGNYLWPYMLIWLRQEYIWVSKFKGLYLSFWYKVPITTGCCGIDQNHFNRAVSQAVLNDRFCLNKTAMSLPSSNIQSYLLFAQVKLEYFLSAFI